MQLAGDMFIVAASDGVWDVMENEEVVNFVENYRYQCMKNCDLANPGRITPDNVTIAQLLCEEARYRWKYIVEEEDVMIDDISAVILEL
jgi:serine/threonine protein phosphatase PrpC